MCYNTTILTTTLGPGCRMGLWVGVVGWGYVCVCVWGGGVGIQIMLKRNTPGYDAAPSLRIGIRNGTGAPTHNYYGSVHSV